jgi:2-polyprenyl-3-methyl-5-hydroxy-6-metoxy-1,4-benzoquinol methylase
VSDGRQRLYARYVSTHGTGGIDGGTIWARRHVLPRLPVSREARILDVGCGAGEVVGLVHAAGYRNTCGIDISEEQVALAHDRGIEGVFLADLREHLASAQDTYDVIIALDVFEHFEPEGVLELLDLIAGALKSGGQLLVRTPNAASPFFGRYRYGDLTHGLAYTVRSLRQALASTGFGHVEFSAVDPVPHGLLSTARFVLWQLIAGLFKLCLAVETGQLRGHIVTQNIVVTARR